MGLWLQYSEVVSSYLFVIILYDIIQYYYKNIRSSP